MRHGSILSVVVLLLVACGSSSSGDGGSGGSSGGSSGSTPGGPPGGNPGPGTTAGSCRIFPNDNPWNTDISGAPVDTALMGTIMPGMSLGTGLHPDWGTVSDDFGIPITVGMDATPAPINFTTDYGPKESDKLPCPGGGGDFCYPIPTTAKHEGGSDSHILFLSTNGAPDHCVLYELFAAKPNGNGFDAASSAIWKLDSNALRPEGWTSADAAGLPIMPGLVRFDEVQAGAINHAIRFTMSKSQNGYIHPATHAAGDNSSSLPPMGLRLRLKASFDDSALKAPAKVVTTAMKKYGIMLADNGSNWYLSGEENESWAPLMDDLVSSLSRVKGSDFEIVKTGDIIPQN
jgi:hypothetical protein